MSYDINVLVNGNRCKQYIHLGKTYVEAKEGSEYAIEIKNNSWNRILAVLSVDSLNVVDGEAASEEGAGYVMNPYTSQKFFGYQYSKENIATFKFGKLGAAKIDPVTGTPMIDPDTGKEIKEGYASSKEDGTEKNAGVIGIRIFDEIPKPKPVYIQQVTTTTYNPSQRYSPSFLGTGSCYAISSSWSVNSSTIISGATIQGQQLLQEVNTNDMNDLHNYSGYIFNDQTIEDKNNIVGINTCTTSTNYCSLFGGLAALQPTSSYSMTAIPPNFDMETGWGESKIHKVIEVDFERKNIVHELDIYYASRESLIAIGIDFGTEKKVSFPQSFKETKYAKPPKGWNG